MERTELDYQVIYSKRKTIAIQIKNAQVTVRCPYNTADRVIRAFVQEKWSWICGKLEEQERTALRTEYSPEQIAELKTAAKEDLLQRVEKFAPLVGVSYGKITVRHQKSRWGSCSGAGNLNFNCLLMLAPEQVRDYVVVHELCHRRQMNHSAVFWAEVARVLPGYKAYRKWLKTNGKWIIG